MHAAWSKAGSGPYSESFLLAILSIRWHLTEPPEEGRCLPTPFSHLQPPTGHAESRPELKSYVFKFMHGRPPPVADGRTRTSFQLQWHLFLGIILLSVVTIVVVVAVIITVTSIRAAWALESTAWLWIPSLPLNNGGALMSPQIK